jgi:diguanylate cyclase (GGDEF)-like protein
MRDDTRDRSKQPSPTSNPESVSDDRGLPAPHVDEILRKIHAIDEKESFNWAKSALIVLVLLGGFLSLLYPNITWDMRSLYLDSRYLPQFFLGLTALVVLYNTYLLDQRRKLRFAREEMIRQILRAEFSEAVSLIDPLTQLYNRRYLDKILRLEMGRVDRKDSTLAIVMIDLDGFKEINTRAGHLAGDQILREVGELFNAVFRKSDTIIRYGGDEFLILMPETDQEQAGQAVLRLEKEGRAWCEKEPDYAKSLGFSCGIATYRKGWNIKEVIRAADDNMYIQKAKHHAGEPGQP